MANFFGQVTSMFKNLVRGEDYEFKEITKDNPAFKEFKDLSQEEDDAIKNSVIENYFKQQNADTNVGGFLGDSISKSYTEFVYGAISTSKPARLANYRKMANFPEINDAIDEICDASINYNEKNQLVELKIKSKTLGDVRSKELQERFEEFVDLFDLEHNFYDYMRTFVIDGQLAWENIIDPDKKELGLIGVNQVPNESFDFLVDNHGRKQGIVVKDKLYNVGLAGVGVSMQGGMKVQDASDFFKERELKTRQSQDNTGDNKVESSSDEGIYLPFEQITYVDSGIYSANKLIVFPILEKARRAYRQLSLIEDAIIIYRLVRAPERWVFNVDTGDLPRPKAEQEVHNLMRRFQVKRFYNPETGGISNDYDPHSILECVHLETLIPLLDGRTLTLSKMIEEHQAGKQNWVYSCNPVTGGFAPGKVSWAGITRKNAQLMKITFDNGESVTVTPDHRFPVWSKGKIEAQDLELNDSVISFNRKERKIDKKTRYLQVFDHEKNDFVNVHTAVAKFLKNTLCGRKIFDETKINGRYDIVHHLNMKQMDNSPENLVWMDENDHLIMHKTEGRRGSLEYWDGIPKNERNISYKLNITDMMCQLLIELVENENLVTMQAVIDFCENHPENELRQIFEKENPPNGHTIGKLSTLALRGMIRRIGYKTYSKFVKDVLPREIWNVAHVLKNKTRNYVAPKMKYDHELFISFIDEYNASEVKESKFILNRINTTENPFKKRFEVLNNGTQFKGDVKYWHINEMMRGQGFENWRNFKTNVQYHNHRIAKIEWLDERADTGTITVDQNHEYHDYHTFALDCGVYTFNSFWFPKSTNSTGTTVSTIGGTVQWTQLPDLEYFQKKLFRSLKVPNRRFADPAVNVEKSNAISYEEYTFSKFVIRNMERFAIGLEKSFETHLKLTGLWDRFEMTNRDYTIKFTPPASYDLYEQQKLIELKYKNYDIITKEHPELSKDVAMRQCLGFTEEEIRENAEKVERELIRKALVDKKVANIAATGNPILGVPEAGGAPGGAPK